MPAPTPVRWYLAPRRGKGEREGEEGREGRTFELVLVRLLVRPDALLQLAHVERARGLGRVDEDERVLLRVLLRRRGGDDGRVRRAEQAGKGRREAGEEGRQGGLGVVWRTRRGRRVNTVCSSAARSARELEDDEDEDEVGDGRTLCELARVVGLGEGAQVRAVLLLEGDEAAVDVRDEVALERVEGGERVCEGEERERGSGRGRGAEQGEGEGTHPRAGRRWRRALRRGGGGSGPCRGGRRA